MWQRIEYAAEVWAPALGMTLASCEILARLAVVLCRI